MRPPVLTFFLLLSIITFTLNTQALPHLISHRNKKETLDDDQCIPVDFTDGQVGLVNVIAFLDSSWPFSYKQADMLKILKERLEHSGIPEVLFFAVINDFSTIDDLQDKLEEETWMNVAPEEVFEIQNILGNMSKSNDDTVELLKEIISPDIFIIEDNENLGISRNLNGSRDQVLVMDRCGKMTYQIIVPWSILHFPYVKAAILSTYKDDPCGPCDAYATVIDFNQLSNITSTNITSSEEQLEEMMVSESDLELHENIQLEHSGDFASMFEVQSTAMNLEEANSNRPDGLNDLENGVPSLRIIMHAPHYHINEDAAKKHEYLVLEWSKPNYHGHLDSSDAYTYDKSSRRRSGMLIDSIFYEKNESPGFYGEVADYWKENSLEKNPEENNNDAYVNSSSRPSGYNEELHNVNDLGIKNSIDPLMNGEFVTQEGEEESGIVTEKNDGDEEDIKNKLIAHYSKLLPWIYYVLND
ncbi:uncharacterized protein [Chelonus insularis]|uniref:uncharacterized protein n=1 Tax=Chelonus insularis TaxID=460826 RepID=UPI00158C735A|nr:uncharacterized protein LOC118064409 [Chelonus insularis]